MVQSIAWSMQGSTPVFEDVPNSDGEVCERGVHMQSESCECEEDCSTVLLIEGYPSFNQEIPNAMESTISLWSALAQCPPVEGKQKNATTRDPVFVQVHPRTRPETRHRSRLVS